jgi:hypothetical protein
MLMMRMVIEKSDIHQKWKRVRKLERPEDKKINT